MKITKILTLSLLTAMPSIASAATCTTYQLASYAKSIANREVAAAQLAVAKQNVQLELENQARITAAMEQQFQVTLNAQAAVPDYLKTNVVSALQGSFTTLRNSQAKLGNNLIAAANRAIRTAQTRFDSAATIASRPLTCQLGGPTIPVPTTINLEAQNIRTGVTAKNGGVLYSISGDSIYYKWSATNGFGGSSTYKITSGPNLCGWATTGNWENIFSGSGQTLGTVQACQKGSTYEISYKPTSSTGALLGEQKVIVVVQ